VIKTKEIVFSTQGNTDIIDITYDAENFVTETGMDEGLVSIFVQGSTGSITTIEYEPNLVKDFREALEIIAPSDKSYEHGKTWNDDNGHSHIRSAFIGCSQTFPVIKGKLQLGTWQQIILVDFDTRPRKRKVFFTGIF